MTVWYNWWTASGWYIIDVFQKRCIYILHQAAGAKTLFHSNLEMRLLNITQKKLSSPCSTNWAKMQNTCNDGLGQKVALHHVARFTISSPQSEWIGCLLTLSSSEDKSLSTLLKSLSAPKTQFSTLDILWLLFFKIPKRMLLLQNAVGDGNTFSPNKASPLQSSYFWLQMLFLQIILCRILCKKKYSVLLDIVKITFQERLEGRH